MGKYKNIKKQKSSGLEIVAKENVEEAVTLPDSRKSDDKPLKKVSWNNTSVQKCFEHIVLGKMDKPATSFGALWSWN